MNVFKVLLLITVLSSIGCSSLNRAIREDDTEKVISLLEKGKVDINKLDKHGETPLISAVRMGDIETVKLLIENGANVNTMSYYYTIERSYTLLKYTYSYSALMMAADNGNAIFNSLYGIRNVDKSVFVEIAKLLLESGADVNAVGDAIGSQEYSILVGVDDADIVKLLLDYGADVSARNTALQQSRNIEVVKLLVEAGADTESIFLGYYRDVEIMEFLLKNGAKVDYSGSGYTSLWSLCNGGGYIYDYAKLLLDNGADVNAEYIGKTPIYWAMKYNNRKLVQLLIDYGAEYKVIITY